MWFFSDNNNLKKTKKRYLKRDILELKIGNDLCFRLV